MNIVMGKLKLMRFNFVCEDISNQSLASIIAKNKNDPSKISDEDLKKFLDPAVLSQLEGLVGQLSSNADNLDNLIDVLETKMISEDAVKEFLSVIVNEDSVRNNKLLLLFLSVLQNHCEVLFLFGQAFLRILQKIKENLGSKSSLEFFKIISIFIILELSSFANKNNVRFLILLSALISTASTSEEIRPMVDQIINSIQEQKLVEIITQYKTSSLSEENRLIHIDVLDNILLFLDRILDRDFSALEDPSDFNESPFDS